MLELGIKAPDFELPDQNGEMHKLSDYAGKKVILYFYPKDNTPGCTKQACGFSERYPQFTEKGAVILGVSKDSVASHKRFEEKYGLAFTLLADPERKVIEAYDPIILLYNASHEFLTFSSIALSLGRFAILVSMDAITASAVLPSAITTCSPVVLNAISFRTPSTLIFAIVFCIFVAIIFPPKIH